MKRSLAGIPVALLALSMLAGCSSSGDTAAGCVPSGTGSDAVSVTQAKDGGVTITVDGSPAVTGVERTVVTEGSGDTVSSDATYLTRFNFFSGTDGSKLNTEVVALKLDKDSSPTWALEGLKCAKPGEVVTLAMPAAELMGAGQGAQGGLADTDMVVAVADLIRPMPLRAEGTKQDAPAGFPKVTLGADGAPTITPEAGTEPSGALDIATLIEGDGETVGEGDSVAVQYRGIIWRTGEEFDSSWTRGAATVFPTNGVIEGFSKALVGQKVGSQVMTIVPPESGYTGEGLVAQGHEATDTMVFVLDILDTVPASS